MKRREFCRQAALVGGAVVLAPLIKGCAPLAGPTAVSETLPTETPPLRPTAVPSAHPTQPPASTATTTAEPTAPQESPQPSPTAAAPLATVALVKTTDRAWGVKQTMALFGISSMRGSRVLLKPNYNSADAAPATLT